MTQVELIWGWMQFVLNVVLLISSLKIVHDIRVYVRTSDRRCRSLYLRICKAGEKLTVFSPLAEQREFRGLIVALLELDPEVRNPFSCTDHPWAFEEFRAIKKNFKTSYRGPNK